MSGRREQGPALIGGEEGSAGLELRNLEFAPIAAGRFS